MQDSHVPYVTYKSKKKTGQSKLKASACVRSAKFDTRKGTPAVTRENDWV